MNRRHCRNFDLRHARNIHANAGTRRNLRHAHNHRVHRDSLASEPEKDALPSAHAWLRTLPAAPAPDPTSLESDQALHRTTQDQPAPVQPPLPAGRTTAFPASSPDSLPPGSGRRDRLPAQAPHSCCARRDQRSDAPIPCRRRGSWRSIRPPSLPPPAIPMLVFS